MKKSGLRRASFTLVVTNKLDPKHVAGGSAPEGFPQILPEPYLYWFRGPIVASSATPLPRIPVIMLALLASTGLARLV